MPSSTIEEVLERPEKPETQDCAAKDLKAMYKSFKPEDIKLWCESKAKEGHSKRGNEKQSPI